jgi:hypothetical protein
VLRDTWVAKQIAREIEVSGAMPFLDEAQVDAGAHLEEEILDFLRRVLWSKIVPNTRRKNCPTHCWLPEHAPWHAATTGHDNDTRPRLTAWEAAAGHGCATTQECLPHWAM